MPKAVILLLDSLGIGHCEDAHLFDDEGANTFGHVANWAYEERKRNLHIPHLTRMGLARAAQACSQFELKGLNLSLEPIAHYGYAQELSTSKDSTAGHWELAGVPIDFDWGYLRDTRNTLSPSFIEKFCQRAKLPGILANCHAPGPEIVAEYGQEHILSGKPICYSSVDSVLQIACHEEHFGLERLYEVCEIARDLLDEYKIGRVIARPFTGEAAPFQRTGNRHDFSMPPTRATLLEQLSAAGVEVTGIGKVSDLFSGRGVSKSIKAYGTAEQFEASIDSFSNAKDDSLIFTNFGDFDSQYGHRRDVAGYAKELEFFDEKLAKLVAMLDEEDLLLITADHGCEPTWKGTDHTREHVPVLCYSPKLAALQGGKYIGKRASFADMGQSLASFFHIPALQVGKSFI